MNAEEISILVQLEDIVVPVATLLTAFGIVAIIQYFRYRKNQALQTTILAAVEKGQELPMEALEAIQPTQETRAQEGPGPAPRRGPHRSGSGNWRLRQSHRR